MESVLSAPCPTRLLDPALRSQEHCDPEISVISLLSTVAVSIDTIVAQPVKPYNRGMKPRLIHLTVHPDTRGSVRETIRTDTQGIPPIKQMVRSFSKAGTIRAMHHHRKQWDIWSFVEGAAQVQTYDPATDDLQTFLLDPSSSLIIPPGIAHGFYALDNCILVYGLTEEYDGSDEFGFNCFDPEYPGAELWVGPHEYIGHYIRSDRDRQAPSFADWKAAR